MCHRGHPFSVTAGVGRHAPPSVPSLTSVRPSFLAYAASTVLTVGRCNSGNVGCSACARICCGVGGGTTTPVLLAAGVRGVGGGGA